MITLHLLKHAAEFIKDKDKISVPMLQRSLGINFYLADEIVDTLIQLDIIEKEDVVRTVDISEETQEKLKSFLADSKIAPTERDELFDQAAKLVLEQKRASASLIQRFLSIGYARSARLLDQLEVAEFISPSDGTSTPRSVDTRKISEYLNQENDTQS